jgi:hypothetical protein
MIIESIATSAGRDVLTGGRRLRRRRLAPVFVAFSVVALGLGGCGDDDLPAGISKKAVSFDEVPETLRTAARKTIPGVDFKEAWQNLDGQGKLHSYEIRGKQASSGKTREVRVSPTGEILESE